MATYIAEVYLARSQTLELAAIAARLRRAADELTTEGAPIRYVRWTFIPEDETCFHVFEASSSDAVAAASVRADLGSVRVVEAIGEGASLERL